MLTVLPVQGNVKNYHWGHIGDDSYIARFKAAEKPKQEKLQQQQQIAATTNDHSKKPLAELWFGAHPSGPATIIAGGHSLKLNEFLKKEPEMIGELDRYFKFGKKLPFLFKILSIAQPLSLQAHPDKKLAQILHQRDPKNYPDSNHKPELAIALTDFEVLCDFRPAKEIIEFMKASPSFRRIVGEENYETYLKNGQKSALADCFKALMTCDKATILKETKNLLAEQHQIITSELLSLMANLEKLYPGDPGIFAPFFLNYLKLKPGQAIYLKANKLHAYIKGECIECMACSDNVVRAGLTTKFRDIDTLLGMLDYETVKSGKDVLLDGVQNPKNQSITSFAPTDEFGIDRITVSNEQEFEIPAVTSGSFIIVLGGRASTKDFFDWRCIHDLTLGSAGFVPPKIALKLYKIQGPMLIYRAYC